MIVFHSPSLDLENDGKMWPLPSVPPLDRAKRRAKGGRDNYQATCDGANDFRIRFSVHPTHIYPQRSKVQWPSSALSLYTHSSRVNEAEQFLEHFRLDIFNFNLVSCACSFVGYWNMAAKTTLLADKMNLWAGKSRPRTVKMKQFTRRTEICANLCFLFFSLSCFAEVN